MCITKYKSIWHRLLFLSCVFVAISGHTSCAPQTHFIDTHTRRNEVGDYVIHWETLPLMEGKVDIFVSDNPHRFPDSPMMTEMISNQMATYDASDDVSRKFFLLVFNDRQAAITAARLPITDSSINMRDMGGYITASGYPVRWGMIARSGALLGMTDRDSALIDNFKIKSRLILSEAVDHKENHGDLPGVETRIIPTIVPCNYDKRLSHILDGDVTPDMVKDMQVQYLTDLAYQNKAQFSEALHFLLDHKNYPILISDRLGKDRVGFLVMLIQCILDVSHNDIIHEYLESNQVLSASRMVPSGYTYPSEVQESLTEYYRCRESDLNAVMGTLIRRHGSIAKYIEDVLDVRMAEQRLLRKMLLFTGKVTPLSK